VPCGTEIGSPLGGNLGRNLPGETLPYQPWAAKLSQDRHAALNIDDPHVRCLPDNPPRHWTLPHLTKAVHTPKLLVLLYEVNAMYRQIFIDGRPQPQDPSVHAGEASPPGVRRSLHKPQTVTLPDR
jgi:hypothetical protein